MKKERKKCGKSYAKEEEGRRCGREDGEWDEKKE